MQDVLKSFSRRLPSGFRKCFLLYLCAAGKWRGCVCRCVGGCVGRKDRVSVSIRHVGGAGFGREMCRAQLGHKMTHHARSPSQMRGGTCSWTSVHVRRKTRTSTHPPTVVRTCPPSTKTPLHTTSNMQQQPTSCTLKTRAREREETTYSRYVSHFSRSTLLCRLQSNAFSRPNRMDSTRKSPPRHTASLRSLLSLKE